MNHIYRLVWSQLANAWIAVAENAKAHGKAIGARKLSVSALVLSGGALFTPFAYAASAADATVTLGNGNVNTVGNTTTINQHTQNIAIDWVGLSTAANEALIFNQPNSAAIALNRITGSSPSTLLGSLTANGQVFILNPNGVLFGAGAQVNVGGLVASTLSMSNADLAAGRMVFALDGNANGSVINKGTINAADGGYVALIAGTVRNEGNINARLGTALLAAGNKVTLNINNGSLLGYSIDHGALNALAENKQLIQANGGQVLMSAKALNNLTTAVVNNTGIIEAKTVENRNGRIMLMGDMEVGTVNVGGTLDASAPTGGDGGFVETSAAHVKVATGTKVTTKAANGKTGKWLIDPNDFTIAASGGDMTGADVSATLNNTDFEIQTATMGTAGGNGDINVNDAVTWNAATTLTLNAERNININQSITAQSANGKLALAYGQGAVNAGNTANYNVNAPINLKAGNNFSTKLGSDGNTVQYQVITDLGNAGSGTGTDLQGINGNLTGNYVLGSDIDAFIARDWIGGFNPIGTFGGVFDGLGHVIRNLTINQSTQSSVGLFGSAVGATIRNVGLVDGSVKGKDSVGALVGVVLNSTISNTYSTLLVSGHSSVGGLVGSLNNGVSISNSYATGAVKGSDLPNGNTSIDVGGLAGSNEGNIKNSYATGAVTGTLYVGGLVGSNRGAVSNVYATGNVTATSNGTVGGLVGNNAAGSSISNAYSTGKVTGFMYNGGLVGYNEGVIDHAYATGKVTGDTLSGGLIGYNARSGAVVNSYWDGVTTAQSSAAGGIASGSSVNATMISGSSAYSRSSYANLGTWNQVFGGAWVATDSSGQTWVMFEGSTRPFLYSEYSTSIKNAHQLQLMGLNVTANYTLANDIDASATNGSNASGMWSTQGFAPVGNLYGWEFTGSFDGQNHVISNLTINMPTMDYVGLFRSVIGSAIRDVSLVGGSISGHDYVGGLAGSLNGGTVDNVHAGATVLGNYDVGGLIGYNNGGVLDTVSASGNVRGDSGNAGGLVGENRGNISNAYATGNVMGTDTLNGQNVGGLVGYNSSGSTIENAYASGDVNADFDVGSAGGLIGYNEGTLTNVHAAGKANGYYAGGLVGENWGDISNAYATGRVAGAYAGGLVGSNNANITDSHASGNVTGLQDVVFGGYVGGLIGLNGGDITRSYATGDVNGQASQYAGGLIGNNSGLITDSYAKGNVTGGDDIHDYAGGLIGKNSRRITGSYATGNVTGYYAGGLVGSSSGQITDSYTSGTGTVTGYYAGGLVGYSSSTITGSHATGTVIGNDTMLDQTGYTGGLVGQSDGNISNSYATGVVTGQREGFAGGLVGQSSASITGSHAEGAVTGYYTGGLVGKSFSSINTSYATGDVKGYIVGGLVGEAGGNISGSYATGDVNGSTVSNSSGVSDGHAGGLVGYNSGTINDVYASGNVSGPQDGNAGGLIGYNNGATISNANAIGNVTGRVAGGLIGENVFGDLNSVYAKGVVTGDTNAGGLVGTNSGNIRDAYATGVVTGYNAGGLIGYNTLGTIERVYAIGDVTGQASGNAGGLIGDHHSLGVVSNAYATGDVIGGQSGNAGGLIGSISDYGSVTNAYATGDVTAQQNGYAGGIVGYNSAGTISYVYATGKVRGLAGILGGVAGYNGWSIYNALWNSQTSGNGIAVGDFGGGSSGANGISAINNTLASQKATFANAGWDIDATGGTGTIWRIYEGQSGPLLRSFLTAVTVTGDASGKTYDGSTNTSSGYTTDVNGAVLDGGLIYTSDSKNVGSYSTANSTLTQSGLYSGQQGYDISYADASLTISKADLTVTAQQTTKVYDGTTSAGNAVVGALAGAAAGESILTGGSQSYLDKNAGDNKTVSAAAVTIKDAGGTNVSANYNITYVDDVASTISKADLTVTAQQTSKTYDGTLNAAGNGIAGTLAGLGDTVASTGSQTFLDKNAGDNKAVRANGVTIEDVGGADMTGNYNISYVDNTSSTINKADLIVTAQQVVKTYDGTLNASGSGIADTLAGVGDSVSANGSQTFLDKNAGSGKTVRASGVTIEDAGGADMTGNYNISYVDNTSSTINKADLNVTANGIDKIYNGLTNASVTYNDDRITGDVLNFTGNASFNDKNVGNNKTVDVNNIILSGTDAGNYNLISNVASTSANITPASLIVTANSANKFYDGIAYGGGNGSTIAGFVNGETIADLFGSLNYGGTAQGATGIGNYTITANGLSSSNYTMTFVNGALVINPVSQSSAALGGSTLESAYNSAINAVSSGLDKSDKSKEMQLALMAAQEKGKQAADASQITPRLNFTGCGMQMPSGAGC
ncbi:GLUG motif-containing protein [Herminiimonas arsenitoxidans]|uniref:GLUG motif-containing protein n=1 Tax=Herminiimonas arsenitoxidans TaxID=1809410 RepID=UPI000970D88D|nr:GLUG motif-containing protein [Herminiimonas arsenitoxidans]